jgi:hypothetical protein
MSLSNILGQPEYLPVNITANEILYGGNNEITSCAYEVGGNPIFNVNTLQSVHTITFPASGYATYYYIFKATGVGISGSLAGGAVNQSLSGRISFNNGTITQGNADGNSNSFTSPFISGNQGMTLTINGSISASFNLLNNVASNTTAWGWKLQIIQAINS